MLCHFCQRPTYSITCFCWEKTKDDFGFYKNGWKTTAALSIHSAASSYRGSKSAITRLLPQDTHLTCVCEHLCFILIYFLHRLARCVLKYQECLKLLGLETLKTFHLQINGNCFFTLQHFSLKNIHRTLYFWIAGETCIHDIFLSHLVLVYLFDHLFNWKCREKPFILRIVEFLESSTMLDTK